MAVLKELNKAIQVGGIAGEVSRRRKRIGTAIYQRLKEKIFKDSQYAPPMETDGDKLPRSDAKPEDTNARTLKAPRKKPRLNAEIASADEGNAVDEAILPVEQSFLGSAVPEQTPAKQPETTPSEDSGFRAGDLVWAKCGAYAFWPSMIINEPHIGLCSTKRGEEDLLQVMFFGEKTHRSWVEAHPRIIRYEGVEKFHEVTSQHTKSHKKALYSLKMKVSLKKQWDRAVQEAEAAVKMSIAERLSKLAINFVYPTAIRDLALLVDPGASFEELPGRRNLVVKSKGFEEFLEKHRPDLREDIERIRDKRSAKTPKRVPVKRKRLSSEAENESVVSEHSTSSSDSRHSMMVSGKIAKPEFGELPAKICSTCAAVNDESSLIDCACGNSFHASCAKSSDKCEQCTSPICFLCGTDRPGETPIVAECCPRSYHVACLREASLRFTFSSKSEMIKSCPRHYCIRCTSQNNFTTRTMITCIKCPATYHKRALCVPAASQFLTPTQIICPRHLRFTERKKRNCDWCQICGKSGEIFCCDVCPVALHAECLQKESDELSKEESFLCLECHDGLFPSFGSIVWAKFASYRWWPARIVHASQVSERTRGSRTSPGDIYVQFFGTYQFAKIRSTDAFTLCAEDCNARADQQGKSLDAKYRLAIQEASEALVEFDAQKNQLQSKAKPPKYRHILSNKIFSASCRVKSEGSSTDEDNACRCPPSNPCSDSTCMNRGTYFECSKNCPNKDDCRNRQFSRRLYKKTQIFLTSNGVGWGLKADEPIKEGEFIIEYVGELIDQQEYERRTQRLKDQSNPNVYFMVAGKRIIDAGPAGNDARFINHSCEPNVKTESWNVNGAVCIGIFAMRDIAAGEELTFNYNMITKGTVGISCMCNAPKCRGTLSNDLKSKPKPEESEVQPPKKRKRIMK